MTAEQRLYPELQYVIDQLKNAQDMLEDTKKIIQKKCTHERVAEVPFEAGHWLAGTHAHRICLACGLEEEGTLWSGGMSGWKNNDDRQQTRLMNKKGRDVLLVSGWDEFLKLRLP